MSTATADRAVWTFYGRLEKNGHRLFFSDTFRAWALADDSGETPNLTDDGVLWIDLDDLLQNGGVRGEILDSGRIHFPILVHRDAQVPGFIRGGTYGPDSGRTSHVIVGFTAAARLADRFQVRLTVASDDGTIAMIVPTTIAGRE